MEIKKTIQNLIALIFGIVLALLILELLLNLYNPFNFRVKGNKIVLKANVTWRIKNNEIKVLDSIIIHSKNSIGFRGPNPPLKLNNWTSIITIGGSTTECFYLSDGNDWPNLLAQKLDNKYKKIWLNNAGLDGHSTFGHQILLSDYIIKLKPNFILFLIGCNDIERSDIGSFDESILKGNRSLKGFIYNNSEVVSLAINIKRSIKAKIMGLGHNWVDLKTIGSVDSVSSKLIQTTISNQYKYQKMYYNRIDKLINTCRNNKIIPILITQPTLAGYGIDSITRIDLGKSKLCDPLGGRIYWEKLEVYNNTTKKIAKEKNIFLIDLAHLMPKSSELFYDCVHFTKLGAEVVSRIISEKVENYFNDNSSKNIFTDNGINIYKKEKGL